jgi:hypothetical protein
MAITATDIVFRYSVKTGAAGDSTAQAAPTNATTGSLGKYVSTSAWTTGTNSLFDNVSGDENAASTVDYRCVFVLNNHATLTLQSAVAYFTETAAGASVAIALDNIAASAKASASAQAAEIVNETTAPGSVGTFSTAAITKAAGLSIGNLAPGQVKAIWIRRTAANSAALDADGFTLNVAGDTAA